MHDENSDGGMGVVCGTAAVVMIVLALWPGVLSAQDHSAGHALHHDVYQTWRTPGSGVSCCSEKRTGEDGKTTGDCYPVDAETRPSILHPGVVAWWAKRDTGDWIEIPESRIIREINPDETGSRGHLCQMDGSDFVLCFVPPFGGS